MKFFKEILLFLLMLLFSFTSKEQVIGINLVKNFSFEDYYNCPIGSNNLYEAKYWWGFSTEYYNICSSYFDDGVPLNWSGFQFAQTGVSYAGFVIYSHNPFNNDYRETIKTKISDTLIVNKRYCTKFYLSLANGSFFPNGYILLDSIGMIFTKDSVPDIVTPILNNGLKIQNSILSLDSANWLKITNSFIANGGEKYLTIGNFDNIVNWPVGKNGEVYVYVDDVSVCECTFQVDLGKDRILCKGETTILNASIPGATYLWQDGSTNSTYLVTKPGKYWVQAYFAEYNITTSDTIEIIDCEPIFIPNSFTPNGDNLNDIFKVESLKEINDFKLIIYNRWGELLFESTDINKGWDGTFKNKTVPLGVYIYMLTGIIKDTGEQIKKTGSVTVVR